METQLSSSEGARLRRHHDAAGLEKSCYSLGPSDITLETSTSAATMDTLLSNESDTPEWQSPTMTPDLDTPLDASNYLVTPESDFSVDSHTALMRTPSKMSSKQPPEMSSVSDPKPRTKTHHRTSSGISAISKLSTGYYSDMEDVNNDRECGIRYCRPDWMQSCASIKMFVFFSCIFATISGALIAGYVNSVITTIEKRFEIGSSISGLISASVEFGCVVSVIFVSYFGTRGHTPKWIGIGTFVQGFGALLFALPHIIAPAYTISGGVNSTKDENICKPSDRMGRMAALTDPKCLSDVSGNAVYVFVLMLAQVMIGAGGSPLYTLGTTYVDTHVSKTKAPAMIAFLYATGALGPVLGFAMGALMLQFYVDIYFDAEVINLTTVSNLWVGAWWGGFVIFGTLLLAIAVPFFGFPKSLTKEVKKVMEENKEDQQAGRIMFSFDHEHEPVMENYGKSFKELPAAVWSLLCNPIYMITCLGGCFVICIVSGFIVFLPKYLETQFGLSKSYSNLLTGGIAIPGAVLGILTGGFALKRFQLTIQGAAQLTLMFNLIALMGFGLIFCLGCDNPNMAGATLPYYNSSGRHQEFFSANLTSPCNLDCACSSNNPEPICGINGLTYFSPCHAGCTAFLATHPFSNQNYSNCACILHNMDLPPEVIMSPLATSGPCKVPCTTLPPFMLMLFVMTFVVAGIHMPLLMVTMRTVREEERAFALGVQFVITRLFAYIPAPILFGNIIDSTCLVWKEHCGNPGACLLYDIVNFRYKYIGVSGSLMFVGTLFFIVVWAILRRRCRKARQNIKGETQVEEFSNESRPVSIINTEHDDVKVKVHGGQGHDKVTRGRSSSRSSSLGPLGREGPYADLFESNL